MDLVAASPGVHANHMDTRADCCASRAAYRVVLPATGTRLSSSELLLCRHHLRANRAALDARHAEVRDLDVFPACEPAL